MFCNLHARHFLSEVGCEACKVGWTEDTTALKGVVEELEVLVEDLKREKEEFKDLFEYQKKQTEKQLLSSTKDLQKLSKDLQKTEDLLTMEKTKSRHVGLAYQRSLRELEEIREHLAKCKGKLDSSEWEGSAYIDLVKILYPLLERQHRWSIGGASGKTYRSTVTTLRKETEQALGIYDPTSQDILIDQLRMAGLTSKDPMGREKLPRRIDITGLVPGGMLETHDANCRIWPSSCAAENACSCRGPDDR